MDKCFFSAFFFIPGNISAQDLLNFFPLYSHNSLFLNFIRTFGLNELLSEHSV